MAEIRVTGTGRSTTVPDEASFGFQCAGFGAQAPEALAGATSAAQAVLQLLDAMGVTEEHRGVDRANVHPRVRWRNDREEREGWDANASVRCTITDPEMAWTVLDRAAAIPGVSINGPMWMIRPDNPAHENARTAAVTDARAKAESYAVAAGLSLGALQQLIEGGADHGGPVPMMRLAAAEGGGGLESTEQTVHATVTLVFAAE